MVDPLSETKSLGFMKLLDLCIMIEPLPSANPHAIIVPFCGILGVFETLWGLLSRHFPF